MDTNITTGAIAIIISAITSTIVNYFLNKSNAKRHLDDQLDTLLEIGIRYPYLESESFTSTWKENKTSNDEKYLRYDLYCTRLFNYFARFAKYHSYNQTKIGNSVAIKDWVRAHKEYWYNPPSSYENIDGYDKKFRNIIENYLK